MTVAWSPGRIKPVRVPLGEKSGFVNNGEGTVQQIVDFGVVKSLNPRVWKGTKQAVFLLMSTDKLCNVNVLKVQTRQTAKRVPGMFPLQNPNIVDSRFRLLITEK